MRGSAAEDWNMEWNDWRQAISSESEELRIRLPTADIHFSFRVMAWLTETVQQGSQIVPQKEIGGILIGTISQDTGVPNVDVELLIPIPCSSGPLYHLTETDVLELRAHTEAMGLSSPTVIGVYRTHLRPGAELDPEDEKLSVEFLRQPGSFFLILKPEAGQELRAALFLRGECISRDSALIFPFDYVKPDECTPDDIPPSDRITHDLRNSCEVPISRGRRWKKWAVAGVVPLLAGVLLSGRGWVNRQKIDKPPEIAGLPAASTALHLRAAIEMDHMRITWDQKASNIDLDAGTLLIMDGDTSTLIPLDHSFLQAGSVQYYPKSSTVRLEMRIGEASDVILVAGVRPSPSQPAPEQLAEAKPPTPGPVSKPISPSPSQAIASRSVGSRIPPEISRGKPSERRVEPILREGASTSLGISSAKPVSLTTQAGALYPPPAQTAAADPLVSPPFLEAPPIQHNIKKTVAPQISPGIDRLISSKVKIRVRVSIDDQGRVVQAEALTRGGPLVDDLAQSATNAARLWLFEPARRAGRNVPSEAILDFDFGDGDSKTGPGQK
jgi:hypothetical protein